MDWQLRANLMDDTSDTERDEKVEDWYRKRSFGALTESGDVVPTLLSWPSHSDDAYSVSYLEFDYFRPLLQRWILTR